MKFVAVLLFVIPVAVIVLCLKEKVVRVTMAPSECIDRLNALKLELSSKRLKKCREEVARIEEELRVLD